MCEVKPGPRCGADTRAAAQAAVAAYHQAYPDGPSVDPLGTARSIYGGLRTAYRVVAPIARIATGPITRTARQLVGTTWVGRQALGVVSDAKRAHRDVERVVRQVRAARR